MIVTDENRFDFNRDSSYDGATPYYVASFNTRSGAITLTVDDVTAALGYTPLQSVGNVTIANVTGLQTELDTKQPVGDYSPLIHSHNIADVTGLQSALDGKQTSGAYAPLVHTHIIADVTGLQTALDSKQPIGSYLTSITSSDVTTALGYTPTSITGLTGIKTAAAIKTGLVLVKADVGLGSVDNTSDLNKPISTATQTALDNKAALAGATFTGSIIAPTINGLTANLVGSSVSIGNSGAAGTNNTSLGVNALASPTGGNNTAVGVQAGQLLTSGSYNTMLGYLAGRHITTGQHNCAFGYSALGTENTGSYNTAFGREAGAACVGGQGNLFLGAYAGNDAAAVRYNTIVGYNTGRGIVTGWNNTIVGGQVSGLASGTAGVVIIADGSGNRRFEHDGTDAKVDGQVIKSGVYTPTVTGVTNTTTVGTAIGRYLRVGNVVHVTVEIDHTAAALADTTVQVSLPIASNLGVTGDLAGTGACNDAAGGASGPIYAAFVAEAANYRFKAVAITSRKHYLTFSYTII